ncbi:MAG: HAD family phosphatase, partial [Geopsychrobacter sp.]|nr:HAD family phosphatase [Geopsychrobacter sp.]
FRAILFDFDGVLGRTMEDNYRAWDKAFATIEITLEEREYYQFEGLNTKRLAETILEKNGHEICAAAELVKLKEANYLSDNHFALYSGAKELIQLLKQHYPLALVTGAGTERLRRTLPPELRECFSALVTGDQVFNPKPSPEPYQKAAELLGVAPNDCLVVENAPLGVQSAKAAEMFCVAICSTLSSDDLAQADLIVAGIPALTELFKDQLSG